MKRYLFLAEPNHQVNVPMETLTLRFNGNGELLMSEDHPALQRMQNNFEYQEIAGEPAAAEPVQEADPEGEYKFQCQKCDYGTNNKGEWLAHCKHDHRKEVD